MRAVDNKRLIKKIGQLPQKLQTEIQNNLKIVLDLD
ncbi:hypothetical protein [Anditalea andensis]